jgi:hypothetical protein
MNDAWYATRWRSRRPALGRVLLGRTAEPVGRVPAVVEIEPPVPLPVPLAPAPDGRADAADEPAAPEPAELEPAEPDWGGGLPDGRFAGGGPVRCWRRRLALLTCRPR